MFLFFIVLRSQSSKEPDHFLPSGAAELQRVTASATVLLALTPKPTTPSPSRNFTDRFVYNKQESDYDFSS
jgi:hypothetical protein